MTKHTNTSNTNTNTTHGGNDMTKHTNTSNTTEPTPAVKIPAGTPRVPWSVKGRGKSATYCAGLPAGQGTKGQRVAMVAKSGAVTFARLTEVRETTDGLSRWDFDRDTERMTPEVKRANRAAKSTATAAYWSSDAGLETARRIDQRMAAKVTDQGTTDQGTTEPAADVTAPTTAPAADLIAATVAALVAAGASADVIAATVAALEHGGTATHTTEPAVTSKPTSTSKTTAPAADVADLVATRCDACNRDRKGTAPHQGAPELTTCPRCSSLDADTARTRAARHAK